MLTAALLCTSCLSNNDDSDVTYYNDTAIASVTLTVVNRYVHTTSSTGADSIYKTTVSTLPKMTINQYEQDGKMPCIYNTDSLTSDCDLEHVLLSITTINSGIVVVKSLTSDSLSYFSSTDSLDVSVPREIRVYAQNYSSYRSYELRVSKHEGKSGQLIWSKTDATEFPEQSQKQALREKASQAGLSYIGNGTATVYAYSAEGQLMMSRDNGATWAADSIDDEQSLLPTQTFAFTSFPYDKSQQTDYQLLVGPIGEQTACSVWRKIDDYDTDYVMPSHWSYMPLESYNLYYLPNEGPLALAYYNGHVLAFNGDLQVYETLDKGITWKVSSKWAFPDDCFSANVEVDERDGILWLRNNDSGEVWRGYYIEE